MTAASATSPTIERRRERRVPVNLPLLVRGTDREGKVFEERTSTINLCRGGTAFATRLALAMGLRLEISIPESTPGGESAAEFATQGRIVYLAPGKTDKEAFVGVEFTGPRFHRMFVSEST